MLDERAEEAAAFLRARGVEGPFDCALVLGTGLGKVAEDLEDPIVLPYPEIPHFPDLGVSGHSGQVLAGWMEKKRVLIYQGRAHYYETGDAAAMRIPIAVLPSLGSPPLLLTNAAGSTKLDLRPSSLVALADHINLSGANPLIGEQGDARFVPMSNAYDERLRRKLKVAAQAAGVTTHEGVYAWFSGPSFETPAEVRMARLLGADLVGMSTVPEVILARYHGLAVAAVSVVTNMAAGIAGGAPSHQKTRAVAAAARPGLRRLVRAFISRIDDV